MSETVKHTPGPWSPMWQNSHATESGWPKGVTGWEVPVQVGEGHGAGNTLCRVYMGGPGATQSTQEAVEANARLIAAAPELLAAAQVVLNWMYRLPIPTEGCTAKGQLLYDAIAKATGGSHE